MFGADPRASCQQVIASRPARSKEPRPMFIGALRQFPDPIGNQLQGLGIECFIELSIFRNRSRFAFLEKVIAPRKRDRLNVLIAAGRKRVTNPSEILLRRDLNILIPVQRENRTSHRLQCRTRIVSEQLSKPWR